MKAALAPKNSPTPLSPLSPLSPLTGLRLMSSADVALWNWFNHVFGRQKWQHVINDAIAPLLQRPAGNEIVLRRTSVVPGTEQDKTYRFNSEEISFGRDPGSDVQLTPRSVAGKHARIVREDPGGYVLEDLASPLGMYLNKRKMRANDRCVIKKGDEISIFPYRFTFDLETSWIAETKLDTRTFGPESCDWTAFTRDRALDAAGVFVSAHPTGQAAYLETTRSFLEQILDRFLRPLGVSDTVSRSFAVQAGVLDFLILATIERLNAAVGFPFTWSVCNNLSESGYSPRESGLQIRYAVGLSQLSGSFRLFLPHALLRQMQRTFGGTATPREFAATWIFPVVLGQTELTAEELRSIEAGDVIIFERCPVMLVAGDAQRGWELSALDDNVSKFRIDKYFERSDMSEINAIEVGGPTRMDLDDLPVRLDVVVGEKEFTLREIQNLAEGSILELNRSKEETVRVKLNGRFAADGELLEIDGRLGVRIVTWRQAS